MLIVRVEDSPDLFEGAGGFVMQIRRGQRNVDKLRSIENRGAVGPFSRAHVKLFLVGVLWTAVAIRALVCLKDRIAELVCLAVEDGFATLLRRTQLTIWRAETVWPIGKAVDVIH